MAPVAILLALFCTGNGLSMLVAPVRWYWSVPGVPLTGGYNAHFIRDIGIIYLMTGLGLFIGALRAQHRPFLFGAAAAWLTFHAAFHLIEVAVGICGLEAIPRDFLGVTVPGIAAVALWAGAFQGSAVRRPER